MAKTYEELKAMGWICPSGNMSIWHHGPKMQIRTSSESDAEFRERLERNTPGLQNFDYVTALRRAKNKRSRLQEEFTQLEKELEGLTQKVREVSLWKIDEMEPMTWDELWRWATKNPEIGSHTIASHGNRVEFFGRKTQGSPLLYVAMRIGWPEDMEGDDE